MTQYDDYTMEESQWNMIHSGLKGWKDSNIRCLKDRMLNGKESVRYGI
jgi:hypothetical protein